MPTPDRENIRLNQVSNLRGPKGIEGFRLHFLMECNVMPTVIVNRDCEAETHFAGVNVTERAGRLSLFQGEHVGVELVVDGIPLDRTRVWSGRRVVVRLSS